jgi:hypothetical protein
MAEEPRPDAFLYARFIVHTNVDHVQEKAGVGGKHHSSQSPQADVDFVVWQHELL